MPSHLPAHCVAPESEYAEQLPLQLPVQVPSQAASAVSSTSQLPWQLPSHATDGAVTVHSSIALPSHCTSALASTSQLPLHSTITLPGLTSPSQRACASTVADASTAHLAGS